MIPPLGIERIKTYLQHRGNCAREIMRHADDTATYLSERCTCGLSDLLTQLALEPHHQSQAFKTMHGLLKSILADRSASYMHASITLVLAQAEKECVDLTQLALPSEGYGTLVTCIDGVDRWMRPLEPVDGVQLARPWRYTREAWQPIETAKRGAPVLLGDGQGEVYVASFNYMRGEFGRDDSWLGWVPATHWMPLPEAPAAPSSVPAQPSDTSQDIEALLGPAVAKWRSDAARERLFEALGVSDAKYRTWVNANIVPAQQEEP
jgi:hypothetical protein